LSSDRAIGPRDRSDLERMQGLKVAAIGANLFR
jgi:hypothetical protein